MVEHRVDFITADGVSAVLHVAPVTAFYLDLLHSRAPENINRLLPALKEIEAYYRGLGNGELNEKRHSRPLRAISFS